MYTETLSTEWGIPHERCLRGDCTYRGWQSMYRPCRTEKDDRDARMIILLRSPSQLLLTLVVVHRTFYLFYFNGETRGKETKRRERENDYVI